MFQIKHPQKMVFNAPPPRISHHPETGGFFFSPIILKPPTELGDV